LESVKKYANKIDEEDMEYFLEDLDKVGKGFHHVMEINGFLMQNMGLEIGEYVSTTLLPLYAPVLLNIGTTASDDQIVDATCLLCDCMENGDEALFNKISSQAGPALL